MDKRIEIPPWGQGWSGCHRHVTQLHMPPPVKQAIRIHVQVECGHTQQGTCPVAEQMILNEIHKKCKINHLYQQLCSCSSI